MGSDEELNSAQGAVAGWRRPEHGAQSWGEQPH